MTEAEIDDLLRRVRQNSAIARRQSHIMQRKRVESAPINGKQTADSLSDTTIRAILDAEDDAAVRRICKVALQGSNAETRRRMCGRLATIINFRNDPGR